MKRILIVDDSTTARMIIKKCLQIVGFEEWDVVEASNGREALHAAKQDNVNLVLTDLNMPVMDGVTLIKWLKSNPRLNELPVVVISSAGNPEKQRELNSLGVSNVIGKPLSPNHLHQALAPYCAI